MSCQGVSGETLTMSVSIPIEMLLAEYVRLRKTKCVPFKRRRLEELNRLFLESMGSQRIVTGKKHVLTRGTTAKGKPICAVYTIESWRRSQRRFE